MNFERVPGIWLGVSATVYLFSLCLAWLIGSGGFVAGFAAGGGLVLFNAWASTRTLRRADFQFRGRATAFILGGFYLRLVLLGICLYLLVKVVGVDPVGLVTGLSVLPAGLVAMLALTYIANRRPREV